MPESDPTQNPSTLKKCPKCDDPATNKIGKHTFCKRHYRFFQMRYSAASRGRAVPSLAELQRMTDALDAMKCPHCGLTMNWVAADGWRTIVTLQHDRAGTMRFLCLSCNTAHVAKEGDAFYDLPADHKQCPRCQVVLKRSEFPSRRVNGELVPRGYCRRCYNATQFKHRAAHRERQRSKCG